MSRHAFDENAFIRLPIVGILRGFDRVQVQDAVAAAVEGGLCNLEVTMNTPGAPGIIAHLQETFGSAVNIGAGTVCSMNDLDTALGAGATFVVTPTVVPDVIEECVKRQVLVVPGAMSPTEVHHAFELGARMVKVFPSEVLGPRYIQTLKGPFPDWRLMPTGGVTVESLPVYKSAGASAFGIGGPLFDRSKVLAKDWGWIQNQARRFKEAYSTLGK